MSRERIQSLLIHRAFAPCVLATALALRLLWIFMLRSTPIHDGWWYHLRGLDLARGAGYVVDGLPTAFWPVGYPALLGLVYAVFGPSPLVAQLANAVLAVAALALARSVAFRLTGSRLAAALTLVLLAFHPNAIAYVSLLASEPFFLALLLAAVWMLVAGVPTLWRAAAAGLLFGAVCLVKPQALFVPLLVLVTRPRGGRLRDAVRPLAFQAALLYASLALVVIPWTARNGRLSSRFIPVSTNGGFNLFVGNNPYATGSYAFTDPMRRLLGVENEYQGRGIAAEHDLDRRAASLARAWMLKHPLDALALVPRKLSALYKGDVDGFYYQGTPDHKSYQETGRIKGSYRVLVIVAQLYYMGLLGLFALAAMPQAWALAQGRHGPVPLLCFALIAYFTLLYMVFFGIMRFHYPIVPWIAMAGAAWAAGRMESRSRGEELQETG